MPRYKTWNESDLLITELKRGEKYSIRVRFPPDAEHKRWWYSKSRRVQATRKAEAVKLGLAYKDELLQAQASNTDPDVTVGVYARAWHKSRQEQNKVQALTIQRDETEIKRIEQYFAEIKVRDLTADVLDNAYTHMAQDGISQSGRSKVHGKLKQILTRAVASGLIRRNPCDGIEGMSRPKVTTTKRDEQRVDQDDLIRLFDVLQKTPQDGKTVALWLGAATGMRRGEVLALSWNEVHLDTGIIEVKWQLGKEGIRKAPKTEGSQRVIAVCLADDVDTDPTIDYLKRWQKQQKQLFKDYAKRCAEHGDIEGSKLKWSKNAPVCSNAKCSWQGVDNFGRWRRNFYVKHDFGYYEHEETYRDAAGIKRIKKTGYHGPNFHSLRHTQATVLIGSGADVKSVQDRLGHAQASTTLNIYAEAQKSKERTTASLMSQLIAKRTEDATDGSNSTNE